MTRSAANRASNYAFGLQPERVKQNLEAKKPEMTARQQEAAARAVEIEELVVGLLGSEPSVTTMLYGMYFTFAKQINKRQTNMPGGAGLNNEVAVLVAAWTMRGLNERILARIRDEVFSIPAPAAH